MGATEKNKGGRPKSENPLGVDLKVRFTAADAKRLEVYCKRHKVKRAAMIRGAVLEKLDADSGKN